MEFNEGLLMLQEINRLHPLLLVGTGLSVSMGIPGMAKLADWLSDRVPKRLTDSPELLHEWCESEHAIHAHGLEQGLAERPVSGSLLEIIVDETYFLIDNHDQALRRKLAQSQSSAEFPFADLLRHLFRSLSPNQPTLDVVTPNYDLIVEYACDLIGAECVTGFVGTHIQTFHPDVLMQDRYVLPPLPRSMPQKISRIRLLKPHGSLHWWQKAERTIQFRDGPELGGYSHAMITPGTTKYLRSMTQLVLNHHRELANERMRRANAFIIFGYGFNDDHLQTVLFDRMRQVPGVIVTHQLSEKARGFVERCPRTLALEAAPGNDKFTRWHYDNAVGVWEIPAWELNTYVKYVIG